MKKTVLSVLAGLVVFGSAFALPTPEDVQKMCEKNPDKYVWVQKTQACIPINPCARDVKEEIASVYCLDKVFINLPPESDKRDLILERYADKVLKTKIVETVYLDDCPEEDVGKICTTTIAIKTKDGNYFAAGYGYLTVSKENESFNGAAKAYARTFAFGAYGYTCSFNDVGLAGKVDNKTDCKDIADFASLLLDDLVDYEYKEDTKECVLK